MTYLIQTKSSIVPADVEIKARSADFNFLLSKAGKAAFSDFAEKIATGLSHDFYQDTVVDIEKSDDDGLLRVHLNNGSILVTKNVVMAPGSGKPQIPHIFRQMSQNGTLVVHSSERSAKRIHPGMNVCVIGGGSSAAQAALLAAKHGAASVLLVSRRPLLVQAFDLQSQWMDPNTAGLLRFEFYNLKPKERLKFIRAQRLASISPEDYARLLSTPSIQLVIDEVKRVELHNHHAHLRFKSRQGVHKADLIVCATGYGSSLESHPLLYKLNSKFPVATCQGYPLLQDDLKWKRGLNVFLLGTLTALTEGPEVFSMMGIRRCVSLIGGTIAPAPREIADGAFKVLQKMKK